jgi:general secretion pathway protein D
MKNEASGRPALSACCLVVSASLLFPSLPSRAQTATGPNGAQGNAPLVSVTPGSFDYQDAPVESLLDFYEKLSGMRLIRDANISTLPHISVNLSGLTEPEMVRFMRAFLQLNGVSFLPVDEHTEKVMTVGTNKLPRSEAPKVYTRLEDMPTDDTIVTFFMPLDYIAPQEASGIFQLTAPPHTYGQYVPAPSAQGIILTEEASVVRELVSLKNLVDVPPAKVSTEFITLNRADSDTVVAELDKMLNIGPNGAPIAAAGPNGSTIVRPNIGNDSPMSDEKNLLSGPANIVSDPRSNRVIITTRPVNMPFLRSVVAQLDQPAANTEPRRFELRYVTAGDILPAIEAALAEGKDQLQQVKQDQQTAQSGANRTGAAGGGGTAAPASSASNGTSSGGGGGSTTAITPALVQPTENDVPTVLTIGGTRLMADNHSNSVIVFGSPDVVTRVAEMVDELDRKPLQVYLRTVIGQLVITKDMQLGLDILQKFQKVGQGGLATSNFNSGGVGSTVAGRGSVGNGTFPEPPALTGANAFSTVASGLTIYGAIGSTLDAYLSALEGTDRFKIISTPSVYTSNNKLAIIATGEQVPVPSSITSGFTTDSSNLTTTASVAYENVLLQLDIIPLINANKEVTLQIRQTNNSLGANVTIGGNEVPNIETQEINTEVTIKNNSTVVIGGLIRDTTEHSGSGIPFLSDIPVLGYLFGATDKAKKREELIIMIQPTVVATDSDQLTVDNREEGHTLLAPDVINTANGVVPTMKDPLPWAPNAPDGATKLQPVVTTTTVAGNGVSTTTSTGTGASTSSSTSSTVPFDSKGMQQSHTSATTTTTTSATSSTTTVVAPHVPSPQLEPVGPGPEAPSGPTAH